MYIVSMFKWILGFLFRIIFYDKIYQINNLEKKNKELKKIYKNKKGHKMSFPKDHKVKRARETIYLMNELKSMVELTRKTHNESMRDIKSEIRGEYLNLFTNVVKFIPEINKNINKSEKIIIEEDDEIIIEEIVQEN